jgi:DNA-directed RNA polymerase specialized sigma24 family protein
MSDPVVKPRWPRRVPPHLLALKTLGDRLPELATLGPIARYRVAAALLDDLPRELRLIRDEAVASALADGMTYRELAEKIGRHVGTVNKRVTAHHARTNGCQP